MRLFPHALPHTLLLLALSAGGAFGQGADDCANAQVISGTGTFRHNTLSASTDGQLESIWGIPGLDQIDNDVWFRWQAPKTSVYEITTDFPNNGSATSMAVYRYGCSTGPGRAVAARGLDPGSIYSTLQLGTVAGEEYLIRIGHTVPQNRADGKWSITEVGVPAILGTVVNPANGSTYHFLEPSSWSVAQAAALGLGGNLATVNDQAENDWLDTTFSNWGGQARSFWIGYNDAETEGVWEWVSGETATYTNWSPGGTPNNGNQYEHYAHFRHDWNDGTWNDLLGFPKSGFFYSDVHGVVEVSGGVTLSASNLVAGQTVTFTVSGATANGIVGLGYSVAGPGPSTASAGPCTGLTVELSQPITALPTFSANASGVATTTANVPAGTTGVGVWFQGLDIATCTLTNPLALVIG